MIDVFTLGDFCFRLEYPESMALPENLLRFSGGDSAQYHYHLELTDSLPPVQGSVLARREDLLVMGQEGLEQRLLGVRGDPMPYGRYCEIAPDRAEILVSRDRLDLAGVDPGFMALLAMERRMLQRDGLILHCAWVEYRGRGLLFCGPSGVGKSTQAALWQRWKNTEQINGDRCLLQRRNGWQVHGWPVCGSSGICLNRTMPLGALVMLRQGEADRVRSLSPAEAMTALLSQITLNRWNPQAVRRTMDLTAELAEACPVLELECTMAASAVTVLEEALEAYPGFRT